MKNKLIIIIFIFGFGRLDASETSIPKSNFDVLNQLSTRFFQEILQANLDASVKKVELRSVNPADTLNWFVENILFNLLNLQGVDSIRVLQPVGGTNAGFKDALLIRYGIIDLGVHYQTESHWKIKSANKVNRIFNVQFFLQIIDPRTGKVFWSGEGSRQFADQVKQKQISKLESSSIPFTRAKLRNRSIYSRFIEPMIIISTTGAIIYLFYSFRSQ